MLSTNILSRLEGPRKTWRIWRKWRFWRNLVKDVDEMLCEYIISTRRATKNLANLVKDVDEVLSMNILPRLEGP